MGSVIQFRPVTPEQKHEQFKRLKAILDAELAEIERLAATGGISDDEIDTRCNALRAQYAELERYNIDVVQASYLAKAVEAGRQLTNNSIAIEGTIEAGILVARAKLREHLQPDHAAHVIKTLIATDARWQKFMDLYEPQAQRA